MQELDIQIISDGTAFGTKVVDQDGQTIGKISKITWEISAEDLLAKATIEIVKVPIKFVGRANVEFNEKEEVANEKE